MPVIKKINNHVIKKERSVDEVYIPNINYLEGLCKSNNMIEEAEPNDPENGTAIMWMSDGTGNGDAGDIMIKVTSGDVTKIATLVDFSEI